METNTPHLDLSFNHEELQQRCLNNLLLSCRVVEAFLKSGAETLAEMNQLATTRQWSDLARTAHRLKGASDNVAAPRLRKLAAEIEGLTQANTTEFAVPLAALQDEWQCFERQARAFLSCHVETGHSSD